MFSVCGPATNFVTLRLSVPDAISCIPCKPISGKESCNSDARRRMTTACICYINIDIPFLWRGYYSGEKRKIIIGKREAAVLAEKEKKKALFLIWVRYLSWRFPSRHCCGHNY